MQLFEPSKRSFSPSPLQILSFLFFILSLSTSAVAAELTEITVVSTRDRTGIIKPLKPTEKADPDQLANALNIADLISELPGIELNGQGGSLQTFSIRGLSRARVQTRIAGVPLHSERRAGVSASFIDPFLIHQVEVIKGPASTIFGGGAIGGVVLLSPRHFEGAALQLSHYTEGDRTSLGLGTGDGQHSLGVSVTKQAKSHQVDGTRLNDAGERGSMVLSGSWEPLIGTLLEASLIAGKGRDLGKSAADYPDRRRTIYPADAHYAASFQLSGTNWNTHAYIHDSRLETETDSGSGTVRSQMNSSDYGMEFYRVWKFQQLGVRVGLDWHRRGDVGITEKNLLTGFRQQSLDGEQESWGVFVDGQYAYKNTSVHLGTRYTRITSKGDTGRNRDAQWTGALLISHQFTEHWQIFGELASGFRSPLLSEVFFSGTTPRGKVAGNSSLKAETSQSLEIGVAFEGNNWQLHLTAHRARIDNFIERERLSESLISYANTTEGLIKGIDIKLGRQLGRSWHLDLSGHWLESDNRSGGYLHDISAPKARLALRWEGNKSFVEFRWAHRFSFRQVHESELPLNAADQLSARWNWTVSSRFTLSVWAENLLDEDFRLTADDLSPRSSRRGTGVTLKWYD